jgi:hypothetical protein
MAEQMHQELQIPFVTLTVTLRLFLPPFHSWENWSPKKWNAGPSVSWLVGPGFKPRLWFLSVRGSPRHALIQFSLIGKNPLFTEGYLWRRIFGGGGGVWTQGLALPFEPYLPPDPFLALIIFLIRSPIISQGWPWWPSYLCFLHSQNHRNMPPHLGYLPRWSLANFFPGLASNHDPPNPYPLNRWDYGCEPPHPDLFACVSWDNFSNKLLGTWILFLRVSGHNHDQVKCCL